MTAPAARWAQPPNLWTDPDHPDALAAAYRSGIVPPEQRWTSDFVMPVGGMPLGAAVAYARHGRPVFPCHWHGERRKRPLIEHGLHAATTDIVQICTWWERWPAALIGMPTGNASGLVVLDIDTKDPAANGFDTLKALGKAVLPETPQARTAGGGLHVYFVTIGIEIRNSIGQHGLGPGLDVRGEGGYVILPSPGSGYTWDPVWNFDTVAPLPAPGWLGHRQKAPTPKTQHSGRPFDPFSVLDEACAAIRDAPDGDKYRIVRREPFIVACLVRDRLLQEPEARHALEGALLSLGRRVKDYRHMTEAYEGAFAEGLAAPSRTGRQR
jgi:hypothetical protein